MQISLHTTLTNMFLSTCLSELLSVFLVACLLEFDAIILSDIYILLLSFSYMLTFIHRVYYFMAYMALLLIVLPSYR